MFKFRYTGILMIAALFLAAGCSARPIAPKVSIYGFEETNYPCVNVEFPDQIRYHDVTVLENESDLALIYDLKMPGYDIQVIKLYSKNLNWSMESLASVKSESSKVYEINDTENSPEKSAAITIEEKDNELVLKGTVAEYLANDRAVRVEITRRIKTIGAFRNDAIKRWQNSTTGTKSIANMRNIVDFVYLNIGSAECSSKGAIDMKFWR